MEGGLFESTLLSTGSVLYSFEELWEKIESNCRLLLTWKDSPQCENMVQVIVDSYYLVYQLLTHPCDAPEPSDCDIEIARDIRDVRQFFLLNERRRLLFESFLKDHVSTRMKEHLDSGTSLIRVYTTLWRSFIVAVAQIKTIFSCMISTWYSIGIETCPFEFTEDEALIIWTKVVMTPQVKQSISEELKNAIKNDREGVLVDDNAAAELKEEFAMLPDKSIYVEVIEHSYISQMRSFYLTETSNLVKDGVFAYAQKCSRDLENEFVRSRKFLTNSDNAMESLIEELVDRRISYFEKSDLTKWILSEEDKNLESFSDVFSLLSRSRKGLELLENRFKEFFREKFSAVLRTSETNLYESVVDIFEKSLASLKALLACINDSEGNFEAVFSSGVNKGFLESTKDSFNYCGFADHLADLLAKISRSGTHAQNEVVKIPIDGILNVIYFIPDHAKELLLVAYQSHLAKHIILNQCDESFERRLLVTLSTMFQSPTYFKCFSMLKTLSSLGALGNDAVLIDGTIWPLTKVYSSMQVPQSLQQRIEERRASIEARLPGRTVTLSKWYSFGTVRMKLNGNKTVDLLVSFPQISILKNFSSLSVTISFGELCSNVCMTAVECGAALLPLSNCGVLLCEWPPSTASPISVNPGFNPEADVLDLVPTLTPQKILKPTGSASLGVGGRVEKILSDAVVEAQVVGMLKKSDPMGFNDILFKLYSSFGEQCVSKQTLKKSLESLVGRCFVSRSEDMLFKYEV